MREALFILAIVLVLLALTAFRYRKQIIGLFQIARALKKMRGAASDGNKIGATAKAEDTALVNCSTCGVWSPQSRSRKIKGKSYCSDECFMARVG